MHRGAIHAFLSSIGGGTSQQGTCNAARVVSVFAEFLGRKADAVRAPANAGVIGTIEAFELLDVCFANTQVARATSLLEGSCEGASLVAAAREHAVVHETR